MPNGFGAQHLLLTPREWFSEGRRGRAGKRWVLWGKHKEDSPAANRLTDINLMFKPFLYCNQIKRKLSHLHYEINFVSGDEPNLGSRDL